MMPLKPLKTGLEAFAWIWVALPYVNMVFEGCRA